MGGSVICQRLGVDKHFVLFLLALEVHVVVEIRLFCARMILAFDRSQHILLVRQFPSDIIITYVGGEVVIENICLERDIAVDKPHFFCRDRRKVWPVAAARRS